MKFTPHPYQAHTIRFIEEHPQAAILLGMGLGKTVSTLTAINNLTARGETTRTLVIAPIRVARDTWPAEHTKWDHLTHLTIATCIGTPTQRLKALNADTNIVTINRENIPWLVNHYGNNWPFDTVIIDELSSFKNPQAKRFKALRKVRPHIRRIVGLTGTPAPNSLMDLWAPYRLIDGGQRLGKNITLFRSQYFIPEKTNGHQVYSWKLRPGADQAIYDAVRDITVSMRTTDHLQLPPMTTQHITVHMTRPQKSLYKQFQRDMVTDLDGGTIDAANAAVLAGKLRQMASGAIYTEDRYHTIHDQKIDALTELVDQADGNTILVAYEYQHERERILKALPQARVLDSAQDFVDWNAGRIPVGLIHPASAGHGLNLQDGGHILVWMTTPWSLELYEQTNARLFRQGQQEPVSIIHIDAADTIDAQVHQALARKDLTQQALITAVAAELGGD